MAQVYAIASAKGGVGKTTTTANLGAVIADAGASVVVIDGDIGMANLGGALGVTDVSPTLHNVLAGEADPTDAAYEVPNGSGLRVVPGDTALDSFASADPGRLEDVVDAFAGADFVFIDVGAGVSHETSIPLSIADGVVLVSTAERDSLIDTEKTRQLADRLGGTVVGAIITRVDPGVPVADMVSTHLNAEILGTVPDDTVVRESVAAAEPLSTYAPYSAAAGAYRTIAGALTGLEIPEPPEPPAAFTKGSADAGTDDPEGDLEAATTAESVAARSIDAGDSSDRPDNPQRATDGEAGEGAWADAAENRPIGDEDPDSEGPVEHTNTHTETDTTADQDEDDVPEDAIPFQGGSDEEDEEPPEIPDAEGGSATETAEDESAEEDNGKKKKRGLFSRLFR
ncbi:nucleotide-binding protein [Halalkalirubrum salinum]|uniref:nucleotide-binding protein n=1 Tax=Halalkalirubrum salinum TaxID=2563889 RepID=UPI0010FBA629|nr:P-loop NTPase [Halalkalirubrum salinum]